MISFRPTLIFRHYKENLKKCSLRSIEQREDCKFYTYPHSSLPDLTGYLLLTPGAPPLSSQDASMGLLLLDGTWRYASLMLRQLALGEEFPRRSIPRGITTAYPRRQEEPEGLSSIEALYVAYRITGRDPSGLLDGYHWKLPFLESNQAQLYHFG